MVLINLLVAAVMAMAVGMSARLLSPQELQDSFDKGQKLYALGDYAKAIAHYEDILATRSNRMLDVDEVTVTVDEYILPVTVAARYQLANTHNKLGLEELKRSEFLRAEKNEAEAEERRLEAQQNLRASLEYFRQILDDERVDQRTRVMAEYQILETSYQLKQYEQVLAEGQRLLQQFPNSIYESAVHYDSGWSQFELGRYREAISSFEQVLILAPRGSRADRSLYQVAECYDKLGEPDRALAYLDRLIARYDFSSMSERELIEMTTKKLSGVVSETSRELVAKAQLKKGDIYASRGETDAALAAYAVVPEKYPAETSLMEASYHRAAKLLQRTRGTQAAVDAYKNAIEKVEDPFFQAETQLTVARLLFEAREYAQAAEEYRIYLGAYNDMAARIGFQRDKVVFRLAQCLQFDAQERRARSEEGWQPLLDQAATLYREVIDDYAGSDVEPDALFGLGFSLQLQGQRDDARAAYRRLVDEFAQHPAAPNGLMQLARLQFEVGEYGQAATIYETLLERYGDSDMVNPARMELGLARRRLGDREGAIAALRLVEPGWGQWAKVQLELSDLYASAGEYTKAEDVLSGALASAADSHLVGQLHYAKGKSHFASGEYAAAVRELTLALAQDPSPEITSGSLLTRGTAHFELARLAEAAADPAGARADYEACLSDLQLLLESDPAAHVKDRAFRTLGATMINLQRGPEAVQYYGQIIAASDDPQERATFQMLLTELLYDMEDFPRAEEYGRQLLAMDFADDNEAGYYRKERAYSIIGSAQLQQKRFSEAAATFAEGLERYPDSGESANLAFSGALALFSSGDYEAAAKGFGHYLDRYPDDHNAIHGQYYLAYSLQSLTQFGAAAVAFEELVTRFPESTYDEEARFLVGENYYNEQNFPAAVRAYGSYLTAYPKGAHADVAQYGLAWAHFEQEEMAQGLAAMAALVEHFPDSELAPKAEFTIGDSHYNARRYQEALAAYSRVLKDYPSSAEAAKARGLVAELKEIQASFEYAEVMKRFDARDYDAAVAGFKKIVETYPGTYTELAAYSNMAMAFENTRQWAEAVASYDQVLEKAGEGPQNHDVVSFARQHRDWIAENRL